VGTSKTAADAMRTAPAANGATAVNAVNPIYAVNTVNGVYQLLSQYPWTPSSPHDEVRHDRGHAPRAAARRDRFGHPPPSTPVAHRTRTRCRDTARHRTRTRHDRTGAIPLLRLPRG